MKKSIIKNILTPIISIILLIFLSSCSSLGPTKPNIPFEGNPYPAMLNDLAQKNPLLAKELGKLPEILDGLSEEEISTLEKIADIYRDNSEHFDKAFKQMYVIGKPEIRKYCTPLQALFWLTQKDIEETRRQLEYFQLEFLLFASWDFQEDLFLTLSEQEAKKVINSIKSDKQKKEYYALLDRIEILNNLILLDYRKNPNIFSQEARKIISSSQNEKEELKWADPKKVIDRLNSPEIVEYWFMRNFIYDWNRFNPYGGGGKWPQTAEKTIRRKKGVCHDAAFLAYVCLKKAGYNAKTLNVWYTIRGSSGAGGHAVCLIKMKNATGQNMYYIAGDTNRRRANDPFKNPKSAAKWIAGRLGLQRYVVGMFGWH